MCDAYTAAPVAPIASISTYLSILIFYIDMLIDIPTSLTPELALIKIQILLPLMLNTYFNTPVL